MDYVVTNQSEDMADAGVSVLSGMECDTIGEILNISMGAAATAVSTLVGRPVSITTPKVSIVRKQDIEIQSLEPAIGIEIEYVEGLYGSNLLIMKSKDIRAIVSELLAGEGDNGDEELSEMHMSAISEIMNQMMGASSTALSDFLGKSINISTPNQFDVKNTLEKIDNQGAQGFVVSVRFLLHIDGLVDSDFITVMPLEFTKELVGRALNMGDSAVKSESAPQKAPARPVADNSRTTPVSEPVPKNAPVSVQPLKLSSFDEDAGSIAAAAGTDNFDLILDVLLDLSVEIGRTRMPVKDILELRQGSVVEFDKQAGDPVDIFVNGRIIAKGDVVIINDNFGVRITEIVPANKLSKNLS